MRMSCSQRLVTGLLAIALPCVPLPALAGWQPGGVTVLNSTATLSPVVACNDAGSGSFVIWQEIPTGTSGVLRAQHLLATGDLDPAWPAVGAPVCDVAATRNTLGVLPDHLGGWWVWWMEGSDLYVKHLDAGGGAGAGWPARGRSIGTLSLPSATPSVIEDGGHGIYAVWTGSIAGTNIMPVYGAHLAPDYAGSGDWPNGVRALALPSANPLGVPVYPQLALAPDGGVFLAWGEWVLNDPALSTFRMRRFTAAGFDAPGWTSDGLSFGTFHGDFMNTYGLPPPSGSVALAPDGRGGVFLFAQSAYNGQTYPFTRLHRRQGDGSAAADWPAAGVVVNWNGYGYYDEPSGSVRVIPDGLDGAIAGAQTLVSDSPMIMGYMRYGPNGTASFSSPVDEVIGPGHEVAPASGGRMFLASFWPKGPYGPWDPPAFIAVEQMSAPAGWASLYEIHREPVLTWYGDIALAPSGDGGAVFFRSQVRDRFGLFARRFAAGGEVTDVASVPATGTTFALRGLRFVPGAGVHVRVVLPGGMPARVDLFDLAGRRLASLRLDAASAGELDLALPGTDDLASGIYFARLDSPKGSLRGRVAVLH